MKGKSRADRPLTGKLAAAEEKAKREAELRAMFVIVAPGDEAKPFSCPVCKEPMKCEFLEDEEEWVWKNAVKKDDKVRFLRLSDAVSWRLMFFHRSTMPLVMPRLLSQRTLWRHALRMRRRRAGAVLERPMCLFLPRRA
jgi:hypothetical protein